MERSGLNKLREAFYEFYEGKSHLKQPSFPLIPQDDNSLLIINSGMAPLKPFFSGQKKPPAPRMVTCQKCIRTADIENVGYTSRHGTFFEMLGSFSFGDYFKTESIKWGWEFITEVLELPVERLWVSVYVDDEETYEIWKNEIKVPEDKIVKLGKDDNFWEIGVGPCGPCSEIYYDRGEKYGCDNPDCKPGCECDRYIEFWNHVFTQYNRDADGNYSDLENKNIDTGMGLERLACIMQDVDSIFAVDTIEAVLHEVERISGVKYNNGELVEKISDGSFIPSQTDISLRIITDHIRSASFMISDKIMPSNESRGYVLRRIIRRAIRHGYKLGINEPFMGNLSGIVVSTCAGGYPELEENRDFIKKIIDIEEKKFNETLKQGLSIIENHIKSLKKGKEDTLSGEKAFKLHDTYGFPIDLTEEIILEAGFKVDKDGFHEAMEIQKQSGKKDAAENDHAWTESSVDFVFEGESEFIGYDNTVVTTEVKGIFVNKKPVDVLREGEEGRVIFPVTPFYPEGGGQVSDIGLMYSDDSEAEIIEVNKFQNIIAHKVRVIQGEVNPNEEFNLIVDSGYRNHTSRNHTATHILHKALREVLGDHVQQSGSKVSDTELRFDFSHYEAISKEDLITIETLVNDKINDFLPVTWKEIPIKEAMKEGVTGIFTEKYGDVVRVLSVGDYSKELCGGLHVSNSGQIGSFKIVSESGIAAGVRRIEAVTGIAVLDALNTKESILDETATLLKATPAQLVDKLSAHIEEYKILKKELEELKKATLTSSSSNMLEEAKVINGVKLITKKLVGAQIDELRDISDTLKSETNNLILVLASINNDKVTFLVSITDDLVSKGYHAGKIVKEVASTCGGGGGGKANMAQAGGKDITKVDEALEKVENFC